MQSEISSLEIPSPKLVLTKNIPQFIFSSYSVASERHPERNEDSLIADRRRGLAAVFDGVGGSINGDVASQLAAEAIKQAWKTRIKAQLKDAIITFGPYQDFDIHTTLEQIISDAHEAIRADGAKRNGEQADKWGWIDEQATTVALVALTQEPDGDYVLYHAHVGDSRVYCYRNNKHLLRLTNDDSVINQLLAGQQINQEQAWHIDQAVKTEELTGLELACFQQRNGITQALGDSQSPVVHVDQFVLDPGDRILLCTDGIHDNLTDTEITAILRKHTRGTARKLVERAQQRSREEKTLRAKADDMSAVVITYNLS